MKKLYNEKGITLAELLAALAIGSIIVILITSVFMTFHKQYDRQSEEIRALTNVSTATQAITNQIRSATDVDVDESENILTIFLPDQTITYARVNEHLEKNNHVYLQKISKFEVERHGNKITLEIHGAADQQVKTTIVLRKDGEGS